ncbi:hypothetical protein GWK47_020287 [Chionoecetes opilio]|uniref:Uncharacterized protein n=1 Tax=Chionoecetes opilio TaxID=41210 RepID=A0A8J4XR78_CHIOP|nr:hypothetical protein GWK47_020287 [Chionoecetes opilio]
MTSGGRSARIWNRWSGLPHWFAVVSGWRPCMHVARPRKQMLPHALSQLPAHSTQTAAPFVWCCMQSSLCMRSLQLGWTTRRDRTLDRVRDPPPRLPSRPPHMLLAILASSNVLLLSTRCVSLPTFVSRPSSGQAGNWKRWRRVLWTSWPAARDVVVVRCCCGVGEQTALLGHNMAD